MSITYKEIPEEKIIELSIKGKITKDDFHKVTKQFEKFVEENGTIKLLEVVEDFKGFDPLLMWEGIKFDINNVKHISHCAVVSDIGWISPVSKAASGFMPTVLRNFSLDQIDGARQWLKTPEKYS